MVDHCSNVAVITGGASGIGFALARALVEKGMRVAIADISAERAASAAEAIGAAAKGYLCDVTDAGSVGELALAIERDFGGINMLFVNAGVAVEGKLPETDPREFEWMFDVNVFGAFRTVLAFMPLLHKAAGQERVARVVFTGSENSLGIPINGMLTAYTATKHAVLALADGLREHQLVGQSRETPGPLWWRPSAVRAGGGARQRPVCCRRPGSRTDRQDQPGGDRARRIPHRHRPRHPFLRHGPK
jgi:NAD(P)-dependent dehydrogenase (short-subunit alcohol dehydrogenase family)